MCVLQRMMGTAQDDDNDFKWRPPTGDGVLGKKEEYQADDNEVFRVDDEVPLASAAYPAAAGQLIHHDTVKLDHCIKAPVLSLSSECQSRIWASFLHLEQHRHESRGVPWRMTGWCICVPHLYYLLNRYSR